MPRIRLAPHQVGQSLFKQTEGGSLRSCVNVRKHVGTTIALILMGASAPLGGQDIKIVRPDATSETTQYQPQTEPAVNEPLQRYPQELDSASAALGLVPADPLCQTDPFRIVTKTVDMSWSGLE